MYILVLPLVGLMIAMLVFGLARAVRAIGRGETLGPSTMLFLLIVIISVSLAICVFFGLSSGKKIDGLSFFFHLLSGCIAVALTAAAILEIAYRYTKKDLFVVISSSSVYRDEKGRTLDEAEKNGFPDLPEPIQETQPTVAPGPHKLLNTEGRSNSLLKNH